MSRNTPAASGRGGAEPAVKRPVFGGRVFLLVGLLVALVLAGVVSSFASSAPDGLDSAARKGCTFDSQDNITGGDCLAKRETENQTADSPLADYGIRGLDGPLSTGLSGAVGVLVTFGVGYAVFWLVRKRRRPADVR
jgi:cobalt/nickel transport protein